MRVLHVVHGSPHLDPQAGGTERYAAAVAQAQGAAVLARDPGHDDGKLRQGPAPGLWGLGMAAPQDFRGTWSSPLADAAVEHLVAQLTPQVAHVHHLAHLGMGIVHALQAAGVPVVLTLHDYHLACARGQLVDRDLRPCPGPEPERCGRCVAEHLRARPTLLSLGRLAGRLGVRGQARAALGQLPLGAAERRRIAARLAAGRAVLETVDRVLSPSRYLGERLQDLGLLRPGGWHVQDLPLVAPLRPSPPPDAGPVRFLFVGHLIPTKGVAELVQAWAQVATGELVLRGPMVAFDGQAPWADRIRASIAETPRVHWHGPFDDDARQEVYDSADVLVVPSTWEENSPLVVREALAAGLRVVGSAVGGMAELDPQARLVPPGDVGALAAALRTEAALGRRRRVVRRFPMEPHLDALARHYDAARRVARSPS